MEYKLTVVANEELVSGKLCRKATIVNGDVSMTQIGMADEATYEFATSVSILPRTSLFSRLGLESNQVEPIMQPVHNQVEVSREDYQTPELVFRTALNKGVSEAIFRHLGSNCLQCVRQDICGDREGLAQRARELARPGMM